MSAAMLIAFGGACIGYGFGYLIRGWTSAEEQDRAFTEGLQMGIASQGAKK